MIQTIKLEIQNDTGVEFEDTIELRPLRHGDYWFNGHDKIVGPIEGDYGACRHVLTPKVDTELEQAKKRFPVGSTFKDRGETVYCLKSYEYREDQKCWILIDTDYNMHSVSNCTPFPLPVWRCCESDKPKKSGRYFARQKDTKACMGVVYFCNESWEGGTHKTEWLDEGER